MTTTTARVLPAVPAGYWTRARRTGVALAALGAVASVFFGMGAAGGPARFTLGQTVDTGLALSIGGRLGAVAFGLIALAAGVALVATGTRFGLWVGISLAAFVVSALCWQVSLAGGTIPLGAVTKATFTAAIPLIFGSIGGVLCERSGVINVAIEGQLLAGAFFAAMFGTVAGSTWAGLVAAVVGGALISLLLAVLSIRYLVDQVVAGIVLNAFALGLTSFIYEQLMRTDSSRYNNPGQVQQWDIPLLSGIPIIGPALFQGTVLTYVAFLVVAVVTVAMFKSRWGLRTRAVGEHPAAADTLGVRVLGLRYVNVLIAGAVAGFGGAYFSMMSAASFSKNMTNGLGFIALAAMIFGRWHPIGAMAASLFFGFAGALADSLGSIGSTIPSQFLKMLPYVATIFAVAGVVGRVRAPAANGKPYLKG